MLCRRLRDDENVGIVFPRRLRESEERRMEAEARKKECQRARAAGGSVWDGKLWKRTVPVFEGVDVWSTYTGKRLSPGQLGDANDGYDYIGRRG